MPITDTQQSDRTKCLGSSDIPSLFMGAKYDLWLKKTGRATPDKLGAAAEIGKALEDGLLEWARDEIQELDSMRKNVEARWQGTPIKVHVDATAMVKCQTAHDAEPTRQKVCIEAKTHGIMNPWNIDAYWGEPGTDEVPDYVYIQCHAHMGATQTERCYVPALIPGRGLNMYVVDRDNEVIENIKKEAQEFWDLHVLNDLPPHEPDEDENIERTLVTLRGVKRATPRLARKASKEEEAAVKQWEAAKQGRSMVQELVDRKEARVLGILGEAECLLLSDGSAVTYFKQSRKGYVVKPTEYHTLRKAKKAPENLTMVEDGERHDDTDQI